MNLGDRLGQKAIDGQLEGMSEYLPATSAQPAPTTRGRKTRKLPPGFYRPTYPCRKCDLCRAKETCQSKLEQRVIWYRKSIGGIRRYASTGCTNVRNAVEVAARLRDGWERVSVGLKAGNAVTLCEGLEGFRRFLKTQKGSDAYHDTVMALIDEVLQHSVVRIVADLSEEALAAWEPDADRRGLSNGSRNKRIDALRRFGSWLTAKGHVGIDPFALLVRLDEEQGRRRRRRAMWPWEVDRFLRSVRMRRLNYERAYRKHAGLSPELAARFRREGRVRALVYNTISQTGLRRKEATNVRIKDVDFGRGVIWLTASTAKSRREQHVTLPERLTRRLKAYIRTLGDADPESALFPSARKVTPGAGRAPTTAVPTSATFDKDLAAAGITKRDDRDRVLDLHSLRTTYITHLRLADVPLDVAKRMARHSDIRLTEDIYTDFDLLGDAERKAAEALGALRQRG